MNELIKLISEKGWSNDFWTGCMFIGAVMLSVFAIPYSRKLKIKLWKILLIILAEYITMFSLLEISEIVIGYFAKNHFLGIDTNVYSAVRTFLFVPVVGYLMAYILRTDWKKVCDLLALAHTINYMCCSLGCVFAGCCIGYPFKWGLYSPRMGYNAFPIQPLNVLIMLSIVIYLYIRAKKRNFICDGTQYPLMLLLFGGSRFFTEFLMDNEKIFLGCSAISFHAIAMVAVGSIWLWRLKKLTLSNQSAMILH